jgi:hypothetical protein
MAVLSEKELTTEQHLNNIAWVINHDSLTVSNLERKGLFQSLSHINELLLKKESPKEIRDKVLKKKK